MVTDIVRLSSTTLHDVLGEIMQYNGHYAVQGHSKSPILVPTESPYATFY